MILEALNYLATRPLTAKPFRRFVGSSVSLWSRANRCARDWAGHEDNSKAAIRAAIADLRQRRTAVVLGSGLLRDVPIDDLCRNFDTVVLVDLVHLASVRLKLMRRRYRNVRLIERDLSGWDDLAAGRAPDALGFLRSVPYLDLVVSANLLSQIGIGARRRMEAGESGMPEDTVPRLIAGHLDGLATLGCWTCLLTDIRLDVIDINGKQHDSIDLMHGVGMPPADQTWTWPVIPVGEESEDYQVVHTVVAVRR